MIINGSMVQGSVYNSWKLKIPVLLWPVYSPDMSPIEQVWDALDRRVQLRVPDPANIQQLRRAIEEEWENILVTPDTVLAGFLIQDPNFF